MFYGIFENSFDFPERRNLHYFFAVLSDLKKKKTCYQKGCKICFSNLVDLKHGGITEKTSEFTSV